MLLALITSAHQHALTDSGHQQAHWWQAPGTVATGWQAQAGTGYQQPLAGFGYLQPQAVNRHQQALGTNNHRGQRWIADTGRPQWTLGTGGHPYQAPPAAGSGHQ